MKRCEETLKGWDGEPDRHCILVDDGHEWHSDGATRWRDR